MKETMTKSVTAIIAGIATTLLGGWDAALEILLIFVVLDYVTGVGAAIKTKTLKSSVGFDGLLKKGTIFLVVILAAQLDRITGNAAGVFRTATAFFFVANEGLSVLENVAEMGVSLPKFISNALMKMRDEQDPMDSADTDDNDDHLSGRG